jgi:hypothetical protein
MRNALVLAAVVGLAWYLYGRRKGPRVTSDASAVDSPSLFAVDGFPASPWAATGGAGPFLQQVNGTNILEFYPQLNPQLN